MGEFKHRRVPKSVSTFLLIYNIVSFLSWGVVAYLLFQVPYDTLFFSNVSFLWDTIAIPLYVAQTLSLIEVGSSLLGYVNSNSTTTMLQISSRLYIIFFVWRLIPTSRHTRAFVLTIVAWMITELIRYSFYACQIFLKSDNFFLLKWLRYSIFLLVYPLGIIGEMICVWCSLNYIRDTPSLRAYPTPMPNFLNFQLDLLPLYFAILVCYIPGGLFLYSHMLKRRSKVLNSSSTIISDGTLKTD